MCANDHAKDNNEQMIFSDCRVQNTLYIIFVKPQVFHHPWRLLLLRW